MLNRIVAVGAMVMLVSSTAAQEIQRTQIKDYLRDVVPRIQYRESIRKIFDALSTPDWVTEILRGDGLNDPGFRVIVENRAYEIYSGCPRQECGLREVAVAFSEGGKQAWAVSSDSLNGNLTKIWYGDLGGIVKSDLQQACALESLCQ